MKDIFRSKKDTVVKKKIDKNVNQRQEITKNTFGVFATLI